MIVPLLLVVIETANAYPESDTIAILCMLAHLMLTTGLDIIIIPTLQMTKLRYRELRNLPVIRQLIRGRSRVQAHAF